ncbi:imidazole glycerol phosphate synthase subunit HisH [Rhodocytophaga aerolata]|uniref:Imidazole glycerol phosphate synthase subunit HisH n=1 Tax=Rhodocytophaga aerolata TaxID=455078 RepID=A0ABT8R164_9BACT|nr:imidazole glycerol phosphate synthase subunit HisH [Rhodocytophaga aerolata]MDO1445134.1 imidazole glycerol phosphate synthase subunit HisH [Rhodocytophaga aerolata]
MVGIIDYGMGNLLSVFKAFEFIGADVEVFNDPSQMHRYSHLVLPGVGAFRDCIINLKEKGFVEPLNENVLAKQIPILGICLGMQVMAAKGYENGNFNGLGWFDAEVTRLTPDQPSYRVPHVGWTEINSSKNSPLFKGIPANADFYFVHSYYAKCADPSQVAATFEYGGNFTASIHRDNIFGTQFHPEKSQEYGLRILENFIKIE